VRIFEYTFRPNPTLNPKSKQPPVKTGGIAGFRLSLPDFVGCFHPPVKTGGIKIGTNKDYTQKNRAHLYSFCAHYYKT